MKVNSLDDLDTGAEDYTLLNPENGKEFVFSLRPVKHDEMAEIRKRVKFPSPPVSGYEKDQFGRPRPIYDEQNVEYRYQHELANNRLVYEWLLACWDIEISGDTQEQKIETLRKKLPMWAMLILSDKISEINGIRKSDVTLKKEMLSKDPFDSSSTVPANNGDGHSVSGTG